MGKIYKITNIITDRVYIGQTTQKYLSTRWLAHLHEARRGTDRKLYKSIRKHGADNFKIEIIEEIDNSLLEEREIYWITYYNSYKTGYNSNLGGCKQESKLVGKEELLEELYKTNTIHEISKQVGISRTTIRRFLKSINIYNKGKQINPGHSNNCVKKTSIVQFDKAGNLIQEFNSMKDAVNLLNLNKKASSQISRCCQGKRLSAYGFIWKYK